MIWNITQGVIYSCQKGHEGLRWRAVVENLLNMCEGLDFFPSSGVKRKRIMNMF